ncbi:MAG: hypothetical protein JJD92_14385 [Frankiaceae bacterium]|nr:hypothetical protein [Frankiaceae bacterium]
MGMRLLLPLAAAAAVVAVVATVSYVARDQSTPAPPAAQDEAQLWTGTATLLQTPDGQLTLCGGAVLTSLPPAGCGGAAVRGLDPMTVEGAKRYQNGSITTPSVRLVGTWDGQALTVTQPPVTAQPQAPDPEPDIPGPSCPEPAGGWPFDRVDMDGWDAVQEYAVRQPDAGTARVDDSQRILTMPFTDDLERHRADIAKLYDGPVCVELVERSDRELRALFDRVQADLKKRGLEMLGGSPNGSAGGNVSASVVGVTPEEKAEIEASYDGLLRLSSFLVPL